MIVYTKVKTIETERFERAWRNAKMAVLSMPFSVNQQKAIVGILDDMKDDLVRYETEPPKTDEIEVPEWLQKVTVKKEEIE